MQKFKILIADDEELLQDLYEMILDSEFSFEFIKVTNGEKAIAALGEHSDIGLIISDYGMPKSNGGHIYNYNKDHNKVPFFLLTGGDISDYNEFKDFKDTHPLNAFFNKPFNEEQFIEAVRKIVDSKQNSNEEFKKLHEEAELVDKNFIKILLTHYAKYSSSSSEIYLKLGENKYTKIVNKNEEDIPDAQAIGHYIKKGIDFVYIKKDFFNKLLRETFFIIEDQNIKYKKVETTFTCHQIPFKISYDGLKSIGISEANIESINQIIDETISGLLNSKKTKDQFLDFCATQGLLVGHSLLIIYVAGKLCKESNLNFSTTMKRISVASFYHDFSLFELEDCLHEMKLYEVKDQNILKKLLNHPMESAELLPESEELIEDTKRIIQEHHEMPNGDGYPKKLSANQISPLSCLFIISQQISFCLIRNNFNSERLKDFLHNSEAVYSQGNFSKPFRVALDVFAK